MTQKPDAKKAKRELPYTKLERLKYELSLLEHMEGGLSINEARIYMYAKVRRQVGALRADIIEGAMSEDVGDHGDA